MRFRAYPWAHIGASRPARKRAGASGFRSGSVLHGLVWLRKPSAQRRGQVTITGPGPLALRVGRRVEHSSHPSPILFLRLRTWRIERTERPRASWPSGRRVTQVFWHVGHRLSGAGELAGAFVSTGLDVASRGVVEVTRRIEKELCVIFRAVCPRRANALVGPVEVTARSIIDVFGTGAVGRRGQVRIRSVESSCVAGMVDGNVARSWRKSAYWRADLSCRALQIALFPQGSDGPAVDGPSPGACPVA